MGLPNLPLNLDPNDPDIRQTEGGFFDPPYGIYQTQRGRKFRDKDHDPKADVPPPGEAIRFAD